MAGNPNIKQYGKETRFKRGTVPNKNGRPITSYKTICSRLNIEHKVKMTKEEKYALAEALLEMSISDLEKLANNKKVPIFISTFANSLIKGAASGNISSIESLFDRFFGRPTQEIINKRQELEPTPTNLTKFSKEELSKMLRTSSVN